MILNIEEIRSRIYNAKLRGPQYFPYVTGDEAVIPEGAYTKQDSTQLSDRL